MGRPPCCDKEGVKKGPWTPAEDLVLVSYVQEHGPGNWRAVPANTGLPRCSKSCRLRWTNYLRPGIRRGGFSEQEDRLIVHLQALLGNRWAAITSYLPDRTDNDVKNYWNTHLKKKLLPLPLPLPHQRAASSPPKGQWELKLQTDIDLAVDAAGPAAASAGPAAAGAQTYALTARSVDDRMLLDGWAAPAASGRSCVVVGGSGTVNPAPVTAPGAAESALGSCSGSISSAYNKRAAPVGAGHQLLLMREEEAAAGQAEAPLSAIESWLLEDAGGGGGDQKLAHESLLLDAALYHFGF